MNGSGLSRVKSYLAKRELGNGGSGRWVWSKDWSFIAKDEEDFEG